MSGYTCQDTGDIYSMNSKLCSRDQQGRGEQTKNLITIDLDYTWRTFVTQTNKMEHFVKIVNGFNF